MKRYISFLLSNLEQWFKTRTSYSNVTKALLRISRHKIKDNKPYVCNPTPSFKDTPVQAQVSAVREVG